MNYPLISEYIEAIEADESNFKELTNLRPVYEDKGQPLMIKGTFGVVFKMQDKETGNFYALKCFTKEQEGRSEAYHEITEALKDVKSPYLVSFRFLEKELIVDTKQTTETRFPVLLMDWVEGKMLDNYLRDNLDDKFALEMLAYHFSLLAQWLILQPFAHGNLKPDNILVRNDGTLVLVDYDGMYVPTMKGQKARELGSPDFCHPQRTEYDFDEHIDDFSLSSILFSLKAISLDPQLLEKYGSEDRLLLSRNDYRNWKNSPILNEMFPNTNNDINNLFAYIIKQSLSIPIAEHDNIKILLDKLRFVICPPIFSSYIMDISFSVIQDGKTLFDSFSKEMVFKCGDDICPYLKSIYNFLRDNPSLKGISGEMTSNDELNLIKTEDIISLYSSPGRDVSIEKRYRGYSIIKTIYWKTFKTALLGDSENVRDSSSMLAEDYRQSCLLTDLNYMIDSNFADPVSVDLNEIDYLYDFFKSNELIYYYTIQAAMLGKVSSQFELSQIYADKSSKRYNPTKAKEWWNLACYNEREKSETYSEWFEYPNEIKEPVLTPQEIEGENSFINNGFEPIKNSVAGTYRDQRLRSKNTIE